MTPSNLFVTAVMSFIMAEIATGVFTGWNETAMYAVAQMIGGVYLCITIARVTMLKL